MKFKLKISLAIYIANLGYSQSIAQKKSLNQKGQINMKNLLVLGIALFLFGLLNGLVIPLFENPRMGLSAHLAGVQNALVLIVFGLIWKHLRLSKNTLKICSALSIYSMYAIWVSLVFAAFWGTSSATPIAGKGYMGSEIQEFLVNTLLYSGSLAIIVSSCIILYGLLKNTSLNG